MTTTEMADWVLAEVRRKHLENPELSFEDWLCEVLCEQRDLMSREGYGDRANSIICEVEARVKELVA